MSKHSQQPEGTINQLIVWCVAAPILSVWALVSLLPMVSLIRAWGSVGESMIALAFLATGAVGLAGGALGYRWLLWRGRAVPVASSETRAFRAVVLSAYAVIWMSLYAI